MRIPSPLPVVKTLGRLAVAAIVVVPLWAVVAVAFVLWTAYLFAWGFCAGAAEAYRELKEKNR